MTQFWHIAVVDDATAKAEAKRLADSKANIEVGVSVSYGHGPAIVVVAAPDRVDVQALTEYTARLLTTEEPAAEPVTEAQTETSTPEGEPQE